MIAIFLARNMPHLKFFRSFANTLDLKALDGSLGGLRSFQASLQTPPSRAKAFVFHKIGLRGSVRGHLAEPVNTLTS